MRKLNNIYRQIIILSWILFPPILSVAQENYPRESVLLFSDRAVYICGESILFSGEVILGTKEKAISKVIYLELISPDGQKANHTKLELNNSHFSGQLSIPEDILSGYYFLRAYTKWMRNGDPQDYAYIRVKIINPRNNDLLSVADSMLLETSPKIEQNDNTNLFYTDKEQYHPGEKIQLYLTDELKNISTSQTLSVIPGLAAPYKAKQKALQNHYSKIEYYPETRGISISGMLRNGLTKEALPFHLVNLHIIGEQDFISTISNTSGHFDIALPHRYQTHELFLIAASKNDMEVEIQIDQDFCHRAINLKVPKFEIEEQDRALLLRMAQSQQLYAAYHQQDSIIQEDTVYSPFYGKAFKTLDFGFYVKLDSLEQYFTDIPSWVAVKRAKGKRKLQLVGTQSDLNLYDALVMVDWVPVDDMNRVLALKPSAVEKIDVINEVYLHGDQIYGGIINILTHKTDFGGLRFPSSGIFLNYDFYTLPKSVNDEQLPFNNTYVWMPNLTIKQDQIIEFTAPLSPGEYAVILQSRNKNGEIKVMRKVFWVGD